ncbi:mitogen-activated protein kinase kinase kinase 7-like isoform X13 [Drosophila albomicans]|uniref:Mitogen-activated protein kinase kinase kinase 7-like isoform X13 n=1 Tax=Drosophila albomicans TaxID=7291 RepID=A0A9C6SYA1_DROAB|nr:mitogen-activated protein kinase kinase kinase 7-like isoform X13 [Drosophila albomicans]
MDKIVISVSSNEIQICERIGYGSYGVVHKALWQTELEVITIALKIIEDKSQDSETEKIRFEKNILREIENLQKCTHPNIITLYGVSKYSDNICLLFEYADCGSLYKFLHRTKREVSMDERIDWMLQCAKIVIHFMIVYMMTISRFHTIRYCVGCCNVPRVWSTCMEKT